VSSFLASLTLEHWLFYPLALLTIVGALGVVLARNPLYGALSLICTFFFLAAIFILAGAHFVGVLQLIVYAGAIMVLFLFAIMLLALDDKALGRPRVTLFKIAGGLASLGLVGLAFVFLGLRQGARGPIMWIRIPYKTLPETFGTVAEVGNLLFREHLLQLEAVSLLLLVAVAGAVAVAKGKI
jgi:NADH-quinone oxidoreductase subunit J